MDKTSCSSVQAGQTSVSDRYTSEPGARALREVLAGIALFSDLRGDSLDLLCTEAVIRTCPENSVIVYEGGVPDALYVVLEGTVRSYVSDENGKQLYTDDFGPNQHFGEHAMLGESRAFLSVAALGMCRVCVLPKASVRACMAESAKFAIRMGEVVSNLYRESVDTNRRLALHDVYRRVTDFLYLIAREENGRLVTREITQIEIANRVGASREMVGRIFLDLKSGAYIEKRGKRYVILKRFPPRW